MVSNVVKSRLEVIIGSMFSGKTTELLNRLERYHIGGRDVVLFKPSLDDRYSEADVVTHSGMVRKAVRVKNTFEMHKHILDRKDLPDVIGVDEAQFFTDDLSALLNKFVKEYGVTVIVAGLDTDFKGNPWPTMVPVVFQAMRVKKLNAVCTSSGCGDDASRTQRLVDGNPVVDGDSVLVGGKEAYEARCLHCYFEG